MSEVKAKTLLNRTQAGMKVALKYWRNRNPVEATFRALLLILLSLLKGDVAVRVCKYLSDKCKLMILTDGMFYHRCNYSVNHLLILRVIGFLDLNLQVGYINKLHQKKAS